MKAIVNGKIVTRDKLIDNGYILYNDKIIEIAQGQAPNINYSKVIDAHSNYVMPGMIDIHTHGSLGADTMDASTESLATMADFMAVNGVTSFLPTTMTSPISEIHKALDNIRFCMRKNFKSRVLGAHLEGPFISIEKKGAQLADNIVSPNDDLIKDFMDVIKIITYAPETDSDNIFIKTVKGVNPNIVLSVGHTNASYDLTCEAISLGLDSATHLFNGMTGLHHRNPGVVAGVLDNEIYCELIADNIHVHPVWYRLILKTKGINKLILISDSMKATGLHDGEYSFGGQMVTVKNKIARLNDSGMLAGSTLTLNKAVANFKNNCEVDIVNVVKTVTLNPAKLLNIDSDYGSLDVGKVADIVVCDKDIDIKRTILAGIEVYTK